MPSRNPMRPDFTSLRLWLSEAATVFLNGCLSGLGGGSLAGAGTGALGATEVGEGQTPIHRLISAVTAMLLCAIGNGIKRVLVWHDSHPLPNPMAPLVEPSSVPPIDPQAIFEKLP